MENKIFYWTRQQIVEIWTFVDKPVNLPVYLYVEINLFQRIEKYFLKESDN